VAQLKLSKISQVAVNTENMPRAVEFYRDTLGMRFLFQPAPQLAFGRKTIPKSRSPVMMSSKAR